MNTISPIHLWPCSQTSYEHSRRQYLDEFSLYYMNITTCRLRVHVFDLQNLHQEDALQSLYMKDFVLTNQHTTRITDFCPNIQDPSIGILRTAGTTIKVQTYRTHCTTQNLKTLPLTSNITNSPQPSPPSDALATKQTKQKMKIKSSHRNSSPSIDAAKVSHPAHFIPQELHPAHTTLLRFPTSPTVPPKTTQDRRTSLQ
jgi:hypothetical protein